jgi:exonuclease SbcC
MIKSITMRGIKKIEDYTSEELGGLDLFTGPNGAGKSTRLDAVMTAIQGYLSVDHGKTNAKTFELANGDEMIVGVDTGNERLERVYTRKGKKISQSGRINGADSTFSEIDTAVKKSCGEFPVMFDLGLFTSLPPEKKKAFLFRISNMLSEFSDKDKFFAELSLSFFAMFSESNAADHLLEYKYEVESFDELPREKWDEFFQRLESALSPVEYDEYGTMISEFTERFTSDPNVLFDDVLIPLVKEEAKYLRKLMSDTDATKRKLAEASQDIDSQRTESKDVRKDIEALERARDQKADEVSKNQIRTERFTEHFQRLSEIESSIVDDERFLSEIDLEAELDIISSLEEQVSDARQTLSRDGTSLQEVNADITNKNNAIREAKFQMDFFQNALGNLEKNEGVCVVAAELGLPCHQDMTESKETLRRKAVGYASDISTAEQELKALHLEHGKLSQGVEATKKELDALTHALSKAKGEHAAHEVRRKQIGETLDANRAVVEKMKASKITEPLPTEVLEAELASINQQLEASRENLIKIEKNETMIETLHNTVLKGQSAADRLAVVQAFDSAIKAIRNSFMDEVTKPLVLVINSLMQNVDDGFKVRFDATDNFDILVDKGDGNIPFSTLSGGEKLMFAVAMLTAIVLTANPPLKVLCLECAELDKYNMRKLLSSIPLIAAELDNVLVAYPHDDIEVADGWTWHKIGKYEV